MKIYVRWGHIRTASGQQTGAPGVSGLNERDFIEACAPHVANALYRNGKHQVMTGNPAVGRFPNDDASLSGMMNEAKAWGADLFVSIHANSFESTSTGSEVIYNTKTALSLKIAQAISRDTASLLGIPNRGAKINNNLYEVREAGTMHSVIVEPFFISNPNDVAKYKSVGPEKLASYIAGAILNNI